MASESSAPKLRAALPIDEAPEIPRAKPLRVLTKLTVTAPEPRERPAVADRRAALKLLQLREETGLTQVDAAALGDVGVRTLGRYERAEVDLGALRVFVVLLELRDEQLRKGRK